MTADYDNHEDADEETQEYVNKEIDEAEKQGHDTGRPGSFLNRLISHGNLKTEKQFQLEQQQQAEAAAAAGGQGKDVVIR